MILTSFDFHGHQILCHVGRTVKERELAKQLNAISRTEVKQIVAKLKEVSK